MKDNLVDLFNSILGESIEMVKITPESPMVVAGGDARTICMFKHLGRVVQHSIDGTEEVPEGGHQDFSVSLPTGNDITQFLNNIGEEVGATFKTIEEFFASEHYNYTDDKKGPV
jgi:hypothetical protein